MAQGTSGDHRKLVTGGEGEPCFKSCHRVGRRGDRAEAGHQSREAITGVPTHPEILLGQDTPRRKHTSGRVWPTTLARQVASDIRQGQQGAPRERLHLG